MRREHFINKLRELGFKFKDDAWRVQIWRHPETMMIVQVRKKDDLDDEWVRMILRKAGCDKTEIEDFVRICLN